MENHHLEDGSQNSANANNASSSHIPLSKAVHSPEKIGGTTGVVSQSSPAVASLVAVDILSSNNNDDDDNDENEESSLNGNDLKSDTDKSGRTEQPSSTANIYLTDITIDHRLGCGKFGEVFLGIWNETTQVAMKKLRNSDSSEDKQFENETALLM